VPKKAVPSRDLRILVEEATQPIASLNAGVVVGWRGGGLSVRWIVAEGQVWLVSVVVIDVFAEGVVEMSPAAVKTASSASVYLASLSLIRNFRLSVRSPKSISVFRAC
jgi:hypothetical protein